MKEWLGNRHTVKPLATQRGGMDGFRIW